MPGPPQLANLRRRIAADHAAFRALAEWRRGCGRWRRWWSGWSALA